ncbi:gp53-like domain-containing protein [Acidaminococcus timonensis]|uniref:gp53-like domain-containing protein n=1 Tax=Acidaminococcus timonensis TaxID=1871002 RepID=UPI003C6D630F
MNRQWGTEMNVGDITVTFPVAFSQACYVISGNDMASSSDGAIKVISFGNVTKTTFELRACRIAQTASNTWCRWIAVGV